MLVNDIRNVVMSLLDTMSNQLFGRYTLTRYLLIYLLREALETDPTGKKFCQDPSKFFAAKDGRKRVCDSLNKVAVPIVRILDTWATKRNSSKDENSYFDYKSELKSPRQVQEVRATVISSYQTMVDNKYAPSFSEAWNGLAVAATVK
jgi:hypothetical protein